MKALLRSALRSLVCLAEGEFPTARHDGTDWDVDQDHLRALDSGKKMGFKAVVIDISGDWAEVCHRFAIPAWNSRVSPCYKCGCSRAELTGLSLHPGFHLVPHGEEAYEEACNASEVWRRCNFQRTPRLKKYKFK
jgi:hypothetical protein